MIRVIDVEVRSLPNQTDGYEMVDVTPVFAPEEHDVYSSHSC